MLIRLGFTLTVLLGMQLLLAVAASAQVADQVKIHAVIVDGYNLLSSAAPEAEFQPLGNEVRTQVSAIIDPLVGTVVNQKAIDTAIESIMALGWFANIRSEIMPLEDGTADVHFILRENVRIDRIEFSGNVTMSKEELASLLTSKPGILNFAHVRADARAITEAFQRSGYIFSELIDRTIVEDPLTKEQVLHFYIFEPRISEIRINGLRRTRDYVVKRQLDFHIGEIFNVQSINRSLINLDRLGIFSDVSYEPEVGTQEAGSILINVNMVEQRTGMASFGITQNNVSGWTGFVTITDTNFFGTGNRASADVRYGKSESSYQLSYAIPWLDRHRTSTSLNLYDKTVLREAVDGNTSDTLQYDEHRRGFDLSLSRPLNKASSSRLNFGFRSNDIRGSVTNPPVDFPAEIIEDIETSKTVRSFTTSITQDTRFPYNKPNKGHYTSIGSEFAGFIGGQKFTKFNLEGRSYFTVKADSKAADKKVQGKLPAHWVYATRLQLGTSIGVPPILDQYSIGGADSLRGYRQDRFPGKHMMVWNNELRIPMNDSIDFVTFVDVGDAWGGSVAASLGDERFSVHYGYGVGVRVQTPIGPIRLDWGRNGEGNSEIYFGVGPTF